ncbi:uncharacterized protein PHACADRAFT_207200 [Phanerochaete carnosa HHB-10118-sp]|uniref:Uncharacterized protein n=1 Tax=Phanerochaete carnosa (strain HHB-10118-sp) TaxID=650164 RepID=K5X6A5_PHACS|nr:uncharacterized protein PHACADRAFT_207200 [Phanerochaete carnosa HHB-10118-sp]EKM58372.1 hypothetical protein PHACADRAFT_207200 [Phanerochaete carnosa HHB-10118-sp]
MGRMDDVVSSRASAPQVARLPVTNPSVTDGSAVTPPSYDTSSRRDAKPTATAPQVPRSQTYIFIFLAEETGKMLRSVDSQQTGGGTHARTQYGKGDQVEVRIDANVWVVGMIVTVLHVANRLFGAQYEVSYRSPRGGRQLKRTFDIDQVRPRAAGHGG